jgi:hypothetical protein
MTYIADLTIRFEDGSEGAKVFTANSFDAAQNACTLFVRSQMLISKQQDKSPVTGHHVSVKEVSHG